MSTDFTGLAKNFGSNVIKLRKAKGMTQEQLADEAGIERSYMGAIERGERNPTLHKVYQIYKALKVSLLDLFKF
jgi:transcriptional regulator with XRE-family HTH domain